MAVCLAVISATAMVRTIRVGGVNRGGTAPTVIKGATIVSSSTGISFATLATIISSSFATLATVIATTRTS